MAAFRNEDPFRLKRLTVFALLASLVTFCAVGLAAGPDIEKINNLVKLRFPPQYSSVNCHGATLVAIGATSVLNSWSLDAAFSSGCFKEVLEPIAGDVGFWMVPSSNLISSNLTYHSFAFLSLNQIFQKANPGWDSSPFELINVSYPDGITEHFASMYSGAVLKWGRYSPNDRCYITQFQDWLNRNRSGTVYSKMIQVMERKLLGQSVSVSSQDYVDILNELDRLQPTSEYVADQATVQRQILGLIHEYLLIPEFKAKRDMFVREHTAMAIELFTKLKSIVHASKFAGERLKALFDEVKVHYNFSSIGTYDNTRTAYLLSHKMDDVHLLQPDEIEALNHEQNEIKIVLDAGYSGEIKLLLKRTDDERMWIFAFHSAR